MDNGSRAVRVQGARICGTVVPMTMTVELTAKRYKKMLLAGVGLCAVSPLAAVAYAVTKWATLLVVAMLLLAVGIGTYATARLLIWWHHE